MRKLVLAACAAFVFTTHSANAQSLQDQQMCAAQALKIFDPMWKDYAGLAQRRSVRAQARASARVLTIAEFRVTRLSRKDLAQSSEQYGPLSVRRSSQKVKYNMDTAGRWFGMMLVVTQ